MLTTQKIRAAISGGCAQAVKCRGGNEISETKAIAYAVWRANGALPDAKFATCAWADGPGETTDDRRIKAVIFYADTKNDWSNPDPKPDGKPVANVEIPHWNAAQASCDWGWYKKYRIVEDRRLGGKCHFAQPMPGKKK